VQFTFDACTLDGKSVHGRLRAKTFKEAQAQLHRQGLLIISLRRTCKNRIYLFRHLLLILTSRRSKLEFYSRFTQQLADLNRVGLPFLTCLQIIEDETKQPLYKMALKELRYDIAQGRSLAEAISNQNYLFPPLLIHMTAVAEAAGKLEKVYTALADAYQQELKFRRKTNTAIIYPLFVLALSFAGAFALGKIALPQVEELLAYLEAEIPTSTKILLLVGRLQPWHVLLILLSFMMLIFVLRFTSFGTKISISFLLRTPLLGPLILRYHLARTCHILALCLNCGLAFLPSLTLTKRTALIEPLSDVIEQLEKGSRLGLTLASQLRTIKAVPNLLVQMVKIGETTGRLPEMLYQAGNILDSNVRHTLEMAITWLEPLLIIAAGAIIIAMVSGILFPLLALVDNLS